MRIRELVTLDTLLLVSILLGPQSGYSQEITPQQIVDQANTSQAKYSELIQVVGHKHSEAVAAGNSELAVRLNQANLLLLRAYFVLNQIAKERGQDLDQAARTQRMTTIQGLERLSYEIGSALRASDLDKVLTSPNVEAFGNELSRTLASLPARLQPSNVGVGRPTLVMTPMILPDPSDTTASSSRTTPRTFMPPKVEPTISPGKWIGTMQTSGGREQISLTLESFQAGCAGVQCFQTASGTVATGDGANPVRIENASIQYNTLTFEVHDNANRLVKFRLSLAVGGALAGEAEVGGQISTISLSNVAPAQVSDRVYRVGSGVTAPMVIQKVDPEYSEEARAAKFQGTVLLSVEIDPTGTATNIKVVRSLGLGLDEKAIEAVRQWKFKPGQKDGVPVTVAATIEVNFRL